MRGAGGVLQQLQPRKVCSIHLRTLSQCEREMGKGRGQPGEIPTDRRTNGQLFQEDPRDGEGTPLNVDRMWSGGIPEEREGAE